MKSLEQAHRTRNSLCNNSTAKYQFTFGREARFKEKNIRSRPPDSFYNLPSQVNRKGAVIGTSKRDCQKQEVQEGPPPGNYDPHEVETEGKVVFAPGRDKCTVASIFYNTTVDYPGPGRYNPNSQSSAKNTRIGGKPKTNYETVSPGPKYSFQSTMLDRNKVLSNLKRNGGFRIVLPTNHSRIAMTEMSESKQVLHQEMPEGYISRKGMKRMGRSGKTATIGRENRFRPASAQLLTPGPGSYSSFSDFIDESRRQ